MTAFETRADLRIGEAIRRRREAVGLTQAAVGQAVGVTFQQVQKYERGENRVASSKLLLIAEVLRCDPGDLLSDSPPEAAGGQRMLAAWSRLDAPQREAVLTLVEGLS